MNDTPETNEEEVNQTQRFGLSMVKSDFARKLERQRDQWIGRYASMLLAHEQELAQMQERLLVMLGEARRRIKELETQKPPHE